MKKRIQNLIKLGALSAIVLHLTNLAIESFALARNLLNTRDGKYFRWKDYKIFYKKTGSGSPVLLIHDLNPSSSSQEWSEIVDKLSKTHTVYTIDLLGCGRSDKPSLTYTNYLYVLLISDFIREVIKEKADVMSTGKSGSFVIMAASMNKELFEKITLVNPESPKKLECIPDSRSKILKWLIDLPVLGTSIYYLMNAQTQIEYDFNEKYFFNPFHVKDRQIHSYYESAHISQGGGRHLMASIHGNYVNNSIRLALPRLEQDIHILMGKELDNAKNIVKAYQELNPAVHCSYIEKTKMLPQLEAPESFLNAK